MQLRRSSSALLRLARVRFVSVPFAPVLFLGIATLLIPIRAHAERVEDLPKPTNWVADFAHVLTPETTERLDALCGQLSHSKANAQIEIVTIKSLDGDDIDDWTNRLEEKWQIGKKGSDRGLVMVFAIQDRKRRIEVGLGLQGILTDAKVGDIGRSMVPALRAGNYDRAVTGGVVQIANIISADAGVSMQDMQEQQPQQRIVHRERSHLSILGLFFRIGFIVLILLFLGARGLFGFGLGMLFGGGGRWGGGGGWGGGDGGGSWGGGGGGGGGFDGGGGGSSDGGGASGSW